MYNYANTRPSKRQIQTLGIIRDYLLREGYPPSMREIGELMGIRSTNGVNDHLRALQARGFLVKREFDSRALKITTKGWEPLGVVGCPLCGHCTEKVA